ncbi:MAG: haloacid dehalogenase [Candidatus Heimdallarchaeota archaeon]|nr:MAG: haloacid dehalogenase [Candidatus Heimdallarchaeota archaeon]
MVELEEMFSEIQVKLEADNETREELIKMGRLSIRNSSLAIRHLHRKEVETASKIIEDNSALIAKINGLAKRMNPSPFGMVLSCNQEYAESVFLFSFLQKKPFPDYTDLKIPYLAYLHGIPDFIGELRRVTLDSLRRKDNTTAIKALDLMDELYSYLMTLDFPDGLTYNLRKKTDFARNITEKTRGDLTLSLGRIDLLTTFDKMLKTHLQNDDNDEGE